MPEDHDVTMLLAIYRTIRTPASIIAPTNCYRSNGWRLVERVEGGRADPRRRRNGSACRPGRSKGETVLVVFWYRLGDYTLFERWDMGKVRWAMRGQKSWPPLVKVLLQTPTSRRGRVLIPRPASRKWPARIQTWLNQSNAGDKTGGAGK